MGQRNKSKKYENKLQLQAIAITYHFFCICKCVISLTLNYSNIKKQTIEQDCSKSPLYFKFVFLSFPFLVIFLLFPFFSMSSSELLEFLCWRTKCLISDPRKYVLYCYV